MKTARWAGSNFGMVSSLVFGGAGGAGVGSGIESATGGSKASNGATAAGGFEAASGACSGESIGNERASSSSSFVACLTVVANKSTARFLDRMKLFVLPCMKQFHLLFFLGGRVIHYIWKAHM